MQKWEYDFISYCLDDLGKYPQGFLSHLNDLGSKGWELVACFRTGGEYERIFFVFKSPLADWAGW